MKDIVKLDPPATTIVVADHSTLKRVSMGTLTVCVTFAQGFPLGMLLPAMNVPGLDHYLFSEGTVALIMTNTTILRNRTWTLVSSRFLYARTLNALQ